MERSHQDGGSINGGGYRPGDVNSEGKKLLAGLFEFSLNMGKWSFSARSAEGAPKE